MGEFFIHNSAQTGLTYHFRRFSGRKADHHSTRDGKSTMIILLGRTGAGKSSLLEDIAGVKGHSKGEDGFEKGKFCIYDRSFCWTHISLSQSQKIFRSNGP